MRKIIAFFVQQNLFGDLLTVAVIGLGIMAAVSIRREVFPQVNFDVVSIVSILPGASPSEVEKLITNPIEQELQEVDGIKRLQSHSTESRSYVGIVLDPDQTTGNEGKADIQDVIDRLTDLPDDAEKPVVTLLESNLAPIIEVSIAAANMSPLELRETARKLERELERVYGVARVVHRGLQDLEIRAEADPAKLARYRLSLDDLVDALRRQNVSVPGGTVEVVPTDPAGRERLVRTVGSFENLDDVKNTVIRANDLGQAVRVGDVARVFYDLERASILNHTNGIPSLSLTVLKKEHADAIELVEAVKTRMTELAPTLDPRIRVSYIRDMSLFIKRRLNILTGNLLIGLAFVLLLLPLLIPFRFALLIALGEPFAFLGSLLILYYLNFSINLISMLGFIIVSGILVDDSIVVTENAVRLVEDGMDPKEAAIEGTVQIFGPITASVLTSTLAFLPMAFMSGIFGKFVREIPIAVITSLAVSLFETYLILPGHIAHWIKAQAVTEAAERAKLRPGLLTRVLRGARNFWDTRLVPKYMSALRLSLRHRYWVAASLVLLFAGSMLLAVKGMRFILFPPEGVEIFFVRTETPTSTSLERHRMLVKPLEKALAALPKKEVEDFTTAIGIQQQDPNDPFTRRGSEYGQLTVYLTPEDRRDRTAAQIIESLRKSMGKPPGITNITFTRLNPGPPAGKPVSLGLRSDEYAKILPVAAELKKILAGYRGVSDIADTYNLGKEELQIKVNGAEAAAAGLSVASIGNTVRAAYAGIVSTTVRELDEEVDVRVSLSQRSRTQLSTLEDILIPNRVGNLIPLGNVANIGRTQGLSEYEHEDNQRQIKVTAEIDTSVTSAIEVNNRVRQIIPELKKKFPAVTIDFGGEDKDTQESMTSLFRAFAAAIIGIFLVLVLTFRSILQPLVVLITVPLGIIAVIWAFFLHGMPLSFMGMLGIVALAGVIVNNAIVLVDFVNQRRREGMEKSASILEAAETRIRPIFLTTVTTVVGLLPTAYGWGGLDKFVVPIAMALGWGLLFGSVLTAFVFPAALAILDDLSGLVTRVARRKGKEPIIA